MAKTAIPLEREWSDKPGLHVGKDRRSGWYVVEIAFDASLYGVIAYRVDRANRLPTFPQNRTVVICETKIIGTFISDYRASFDGGRR
jgi:hypothetical protein